LKKTRELGKEEAKAGKRLVRTNGDTGRKGKEKHVRGGWHKG